MSRARLLDNVIAQLESHTHECLKVFTQKTKKNLNLGISDYICYRNVAFRNKFRTNIVKLPQEISLF